jgi:lipopolysaccharide/colanic/teichoic acid biosynthesis glycosyltransferase
MRHDDRSQVRFADRVGRALDILLAVIGLVVLSPVMLIIATATILESGRPVLFSQIRLGRDGRHFRMYKFRKFRPDCSASGLPLTLCNDDRTSNVGRFLAITKLDELPQLYNILRGDMAFVGPRPESLAFAGCFDEQHQAVLDYKPGIFGPSQAAFRSEAKLYPENEDLISFYREVLFPLKASLDLEYYPRRTLFKDLAWIVRGVLAVIGLYPRLTQRPTETFLRTNRSAVTVRTGHQVMRLARRRARAA